MLKQKLRALLLAPLILSLISPAQAQKPPTSRPLGGALPTYTLSQYFNENKWDDALKNIEIEMKRQPATEADFLLVARAFILAEKKDWLKVNETLKPLSVRSGLWSDYVYLLIAQAEFHLGQVKESRASAERILRDETSRKVFNDAQILLSKIALVEGRFADARGLLVGLEKRVRNEGDYAGVLWNLALSERGLGKTREFCQRVTKIYREFPELDEVKDWGPFSDENKMANKETLCAFSWDDLLDRNRNLMLSGQIARAKAEIEKVEKRAQGQKSFEIDRLKAHYFLHEGEVTQALELLAPYYSQRKNDVSYLGVIASAAARAGDSKTSIGAYMAIHKLAPNSSRAKQALFQAAFMSYQYQDYDGATRRFRQFLKENGSSGLALDAEWHLAWISYLKGNYDRAYRSLADVKEKMRSRKFRHFQRRGHQTADRVEYWMAMSQLRLKNFELARRLFDEVVKQNGDGYYALAARQRLKMLESMRPRRIARWTVASGSRRPASPSRPMLMSSDAGSMWADSMPDSSLESSEDAISINPLEETGELQAAEEGGEGTDQKIVEIGEIPGNLSSSLNPMINQKFERARRLISLGLTELAKWELYDIERKTANRDYLRQLTGEYEKIEQFHRSSAIATHRFIALRKEGMLQQKALWESAYPRAFEKSVAESSGKFDVSKELIWAIMRAESAFKRDAVSPVGALGLMQVMPKTGEKLTELMGESGFKPRSLLEPPVAIRLGTRYLQRLSKTLDNNRALMAASYNAGPHRVKTWLNRFGVLELDEFIEHIPFLETRNYVKKVVTNFQVYATLYSNQNDVFPELTQPISIRILEPVPMKETWEDI